jgi:hypothetical protein
MPEVRPPKDESWRTVTLPEAVYVDLKQSERKAQVATDALARVTRSMEVYAKRVGLELSGNAETQLGQLVAEYRNRAERAEQEMDRIYGFCEGQLEVARVKAVGQHSYYRGVEVTALAVLATKHSNESQKPINLPLDAEATDLLERVLEHELEAQPAAAVEGTEPAVWTEYHRIPITKDDEAAAWKAESGDPLADAMATIKTMEMSKIGKLIFRASVQQVAADLPAETGEKWVPFPLMGGYCLLVTGLVATREQAEAAAAWVNATTGNLNGDWEKSFHQNFRNGHFTCHGGMATVKAFIQATVSRLQSELAAAEKDRKAMRDLLILTRRHLGYEDSGDVILKIDAILALAAELERSETT